MTSHTPGPWFDVSEVGRSVSEIYPTIWRGQNNAESKCASIARVSLWAGEPKHMAEAEANARLIAAAPELLGIARRWAALDGGDWHVERHAREKRELLDETRAAIAKATGATP